MISILQLIIILFIPAFMIFFAVTRKRDLINGETKGWAFKFRKRALSEEEHMRANLMYCNIILYCGINVGLVSLIFALFILIRYGPSWIMCITFVLLQLIAGFALSYIVTRALARRFKRPEVQEKQDDPDQDEQ